MRRIAGILVVVLLLIAGAMPRAEASLILDRQPHNSGGPSADTLWSTTFEGDLWSEVADDFELASPTTINRIDWWGFYGTNFGEGAQPPNDNEVMRIRIHSARIGDGLPGNILFEETVTNPARVPTGRTVFAGGQYPERKYRIDLAAPVVLGASTTYWLDIAQVGAAESAFRWEYSLTPPAHDFAFFAYFSTDWELAGTTSGLAFQLYDIPEPNTFSLAMVIGLFGCRAGRLRRHLVSLERRQLNIMRACKVFPFLTVLVLVAIATPSAKASLILDRQPHNSGGPGADTLWNDIFLGDYWQESADDFQFSTMKTISRIDWWGFYGGNFGEGPQPPSGSEAMRMRIHSARVGDGLPGDIVYEETVINPVRTLTGRTVFAGGQYPERKYRVDLATPIELDANTTYWLDIAQFGASESLFRWEYSLTPPTNAFASRWIDSPEWQLSQLQNTGLAFQLYDIPEPSTFSLAMVIVLFGCRAGRLRRRLVSLERRQLNVASAGKVFSFLTALALVAIGPPSAEASLIIDRQPHPAGGPSADTMWSTTFEGDLWSEAADDFMLANPTTINRIDWWGFYGTNFGEGAQPPNGNEVMRIRIHAARAGDGLPGDTIFEEQFMNPERTLTGRNVASSPAFPERKYRVDLTVPISLEANNTYWLDIAQIGAAESAFRWEYSLTPPAHDFAFFAYFSTDWELAGTTSGLAFQLYDIPEPSTFSLATVTALFGCRAGRFRRRLVSLERRQLNVIATDRYKPKGPV